MGIQLPPELVDFAARAGVEWPEADEDRMRQAATAWRDAGTKLTHLTRDADHVAQAALSSSEGPAADAARRHWSSFVHPDTGHLTATAHGCRAAADRLDHAANQVGAAKVEIVRNLVDLARNTDAAHQAASAGHPNALLGLDTSTRGTAANVANITNNLVTAVAPASGVDVSAVPDLVNPNPGAHAPPAVPDAVTGAVDSVAGKGNPVHSVVEPVVATVDPGPGGPANPGAGTGNPVHTVVEPVVSAVDPVVGAVDPVVGPGGSVRGAVDPVVGAVHPGDEFGPVPGTGPAGPDWPAPRNPDATGPVRILPDPPTPPTGTPHGQTVQAGFAPALAEPVAPPPGPAATGGPAPLGPGAPAPVAGPGPGGAPVPPPAPGAPAAPAPPVAGGPSAPAPAGPAPVAPDRARGGFSAVVAPGPAAPGPAAAGPVPPGPPPRDRRDESLTLFWVHMFPIGHMPVVADRPARQLPPPPAEVDYAPGLRFEPGDHPEHHLVDGAQRLEELRTGVPPLQPGVGLPVEHPRVGALAQDYDPLGGQHERDWDRRFLVRLGSVTPHGISSEGKEYAWPPGESYPEGGTDSGEAVLLAEGTVIDRFGTPEGRVFSADATGFARRCLPPDQLGSGYRRYRVTRPLPVWRTVSAPWFAQPGGGERYRSTYSAQELVALGYLAEITGVGE